VNRITPETRGFDTRDKIAANLRSTIGLIVGLLILWAQSASGADVIDLHMGSYTDDGGLTVHTPSLSLTKELPTQTTLNIKYTYETFEKEAPSDAADAVTGATTVSGGSGGGYDEVRKEIVGGGSQRIGPLSVAIGGFYGNENDYLSQAYSLGATVELFQKNLTITGVYGKTADQIEDLTDPTFLEHKDNATYTIAATQLVTPRFLVTGGYSLSQVEGFQSSPTRKIQVPLAIGSHIYDEVHPDLRDRQTFFLRFRQYFRSETSGDLNLSYYFDTWGVRAIGAEPRVERRLTPSVAVRLRYRFYSQSAADFYQEVYTAQDVTPTSIKTADVKLRDFDTHTIGVALRLLGDTSTDWSVLMGYDRYLETNNGLKANIFQVTLSIPY
jgi:hypothetical protein